MRTRALLLTICLASAGLAAPAASAQTRPRSAAEIAKHAIPATVTILNIDSRGDTVALGSGFLVSGDGIIVTNYHVMTGAASAVVVLSDGERFSRVSGLDGDKDIDVALIKIPGAALPFLTTSTTLPPVGSKVTVVGSPMGLAATVTDGVVSSRRVVEGRELLQMTAPISHGSSGGPVMDERGNVIAISTLYLDSGQSLNFAVPVRYAVGLMRQRPKAKTLAAVFGSGPDRTATTAVSERRGTPAQRLPVPAATANPRRDIFGVYEGLMQEYCDAPTSWAGAPDRATLIIGSGDIGWLIAGRVGDKDMNTPFNVSRVQSNAEGRVALGFGAAVLDGYQTDDGIYVDLRMGDTDTCTTHRAAMQWTLTSFPLSQSVGLYDVTAHTFYYEDDKITGQPIDFTGQAAVVVAKDSVFIDVHLKNERLGDVGVTWGGSVAADGSFALAFRSKDGSVGELTGSVLSGRLVARWKNAWKDGTYIAGDLVANRR